MYYRLQRYSSVIHQSYLITSALYITCPFNVHRLSPLRNSEAEDSAKLCPEFFPIEIMREMWVVLSYWISGKLIQWQWDNDHKHQDIMKKFLAYWEQNRVLVVKVLYLSESQFALFIKWGSWRRISLTFFSRLNLI